MARYKGKDGAISVGAVEIGEVESFDFEMTANELDANTMGNDWTDVDAGQKSMSGSIAVLRDPGDPGQTALSVGDKVDLHLFPEGETSGLTEVEGSCLITSKGVSTSVGDQVKTSYNFRNAGEITEGTV